MNGQNGSTGSHNEELKQRVGKKKMVQPFSSVLCLDLNMQTKY